MHTSIPIKAKVGFWIFLTGFCFFYQSAFSQELVDSLRQVLTTASPQDTNRIHLLNDLAWELKFSDAEQARQYLEESVQLARQLDFRKGEGQALNNRGVVETIAGNYTLAIPFYEQALSIREQLGDRKGVASLYNNIGNLQEELGNYPAALENLKQSLRIRESLGDTLRMARATHNLSLVQERMGNYPEALDLSLRYLSTSELLGDQYEIANAHNQLGNIKTELERFDEAKAHYLQSLELRRELGDPYELAQSLQNLGNIQDDHGETAMDSAQYDQAKELYRSALDYYEQALTIYREAEDQEGISAAFNNIGLVYKNLGSYYKELDDLQAANAEWQRALDYLQQALALRQASEDRLGLIEVYNGLGDVYRRQGRFQLALKYTEDYLAIAEELGDQKFIQNAYKDLSRVYAAQKNYTKAFRFRKAYDELRYARLNEERTRQNSRREAIYGDEQKQREIERQEAALELQNARLREASILRNSLITGALLLLLLAALLYNRYRIKSRANQALAVKNSIIEQERERSDALLLNILPEATAEELKTHGKTSAQAYDSVTVLFTDFANFTQIASRLPAQQLVTILDECFRAFDKITTSYGIEKIKTIGDAYMCAGGLPHPNDTHAADVVRAALDMQAVVRDIAEKYPVQEQIVFKARIGIHTGPVVAGVVGSKKFAYDIWGDTVNTAARMESSGQVGKVNISQATYEQLDDRFVCIPRGKVAAKNKGEIEMFFVQEFSQRR